MSAEILFMMNSHPVNDVFYGSATENYGDIDLDNVKRIEFVSGPATALYGSGAMWPASSISLPRKRRMSQLEYAVVLQGELVPE